MVPEVARLERAFSEIDFEKLSSEELAELRAFLTLRVDEISRIVVARKHYLKRFHPSDLKK